MDGDQRHEKAGEQDAQGQDGNGARQGREDGGQHEAARLREMMREALAGSPARAERYAHLFEKAGRAAGPSEDDEEAKEPRGAFSGVYDAMVRMQGLRMRMLRAKRASSWPDATPEERERDRLAWERLWDEMVERLEREAMESPDLWAVPDRDGAAMCPIDELMAEMDQAWTADLEAEAEQRAAASEQARMRRFARLCEAARAWWSRQRARAMENGHGE